MFIEIVFKILLFKGGVLIYAEHCICLVLNISLFNFDPFLCFKKQDIIF